MPANGTNAEYSGHEYLEICEVSNNSDLCGGHMTAFIRNLTSRNVLCNLNGFQISPNFPRVHTDCENNEKVPHFQYFVSRFGL